MTPEQQAEFEVLDAMSRSAMELLIARWRTCGAPMDQLAKLLLGSATHLALHGDISACDFSWNEDPV